MDLKIFKKNIRNCQKGFSLLEIIIVLAVGSAVFLSIEQYLDLSLKSLAQDTRQTEALYYAKSLLEQARSLRDENWTNISGLTIGSNYFFQSNGASPAKWLAQAGTSTIGKYTMWIKTSAVNRDNVSKNIVTSGGSLDANTLKITASVSWVNNGTTRQINIFEYLTNFK